MDRRGEVTSPTGGGGAEAGVDSRDDVVTGEIAVRGGTVRFTHPRAGSDLLYETDTEQDVQFPPYWADLWPSGVELAHAVSASSMAGVSVVELGCGLALPSIAAALGGARVLATDRSPDALTYAADNAANNGAAVETALACWTEPGPLLRRAPWQLVLAADVLYEERNVAWLLPLLPRLVGDSGEVWIADPQRPTAEEFLTRAAADGWHVSTRTTRIPTVRIHRLAPSTHPDAERGPA